MSQSTKSKPASSSVFPGPGFRVKTEFERPDPELIAKFAEYPTPDISDLMNRLYTMHPELKNLVNDKPLLGPALTVKVFPGDNLMVHKALDLVKPGDIIVIDAGGSGMNGIIGDLIATKAHHRGVQGFVVDGLVRDIEGIQEVGMPVFARGVTPIGPLHRGPGEINHSVSCGGIVVHPGDLIAGDHNGITVVRRELVSEMHDRLVQQRDSLKEYTEAVRRGEFSNAWVDALLQLHNCEFED